jgi:hypothetical protein
MATYDKCCVEIRKVIPYEYFTVEVSDEEPYVITTLYLDGRFTKRELEQVLDIFKEYQGKAAYSE